MRNTCGNCGFGWNEATPYCPRCGASLAPVTRSKIDGATKAVLGYGFIIFGAVGACFSYVGFGRAFDPSPFNAFSLFGMALLCFAGFLLWNLVRGGR